MSVRYLNILALSAVVLWTCSFSTTPVTALSIDAGLHVRHAHIGHAFAKRAPRRCKPRSLAAGGDPTTSATTPVATPANSPSPSPAPAPAPAPNTGGKHAGLAVSIWDGSWQDTMNHFQGLSKVAIFYNWGMTYQYQGTSNLIYAPMLSRPSAVSQWNAAFVDGPDHPQYALGFNEPERGDQANISPGDAIGIWYSSMIPLRNKGTILVSPGVSSADAGAAWMDSFFNGCPNCFDRVAVHWYGVVADEFISYLQLQHNKYGKPLWVTEFACMSFGGGGACPDVAAFAQKVTAFMDTCGFVEYYFPFVVSQDMAGVSEVNRLDAGTYPTSLAGIYFGY